MERGIKQMSNLIVNTLYGQVQGEKVENVFVWKGIPYAKPPVGRLRFRRPERPEPWDNVRDATEFGPTAMQPKSEMMRFLGDSPEGSSEDCLYLNVWSPGADNKRRPVMVWIHGGAFMYGSGSSETYDGTSFAQTGDLVVVTINYRLGAFGFLHLEEIGGESFAESGNCGILDQVAALKWVQENIEAFGGDSNNVTVFGESAGAMSVGTLLATKEAEGLFQKAILQSGAASNVLPSKVGTNIANRILSELGIQHDELDKLYDVSAEELVKASETVPPMTLVPVVDKSVIPVQPLQALAQGSAKNIPILIGTTEDEYRLFTFVDPTWRKLDDEGTEKRFKAAFGKSWPRMSEQLKGETLTQELFEKLMTWQMFTYPAITLSETRIKRGEKVWMYRFDYKSTAFGGGLKSCHALELPFVWNTVKNQRTTAFTGDVPERFTIAEQMHHAWIAFAKNGNPSIPQLPEWPEYDLNSRTTMHFNLETKVQHDPAKEERLFWERVASEQNPLEDDHKEKPSLL